MINLTLNILNLNILNWCIFQFKIFKQLPYTCRAFEIRIFLALHCLLFYLAISQCGSVSFGLMKLHNRFQLLHNYWNVSVDRPQQAASWGWQGARRRRYVDSGLRDCGAGTGEERRGGQPQCHAKQRAVKFSRRSKRVLHKNANANAKRKWNAIFQYNANNNGNQKFIGDDRQTHWEHHRHSLCGSMELYVSGSRCCYCCLLNMKHLIAKLLQIAGNIIWTMDKWQLTTGNCQLAIGYWQLVAYVLAAIEFTKCTTIKWLALLKTIYFCNTWRMRNFILD